MNRCQVMARNYWSGWGRPLSASRTTITTTTESHRLWKGIMLWILRLIRFVLQANVWHSLSFHRSTHRSISLICCSLSLTISITLSNCLNVTMSSLTFWAIVSMRIVRLCDLHHLIVHRESKLSSLSKSNSPFAVGFVGAIVCDILKTPPPLNGRRDLICI